MAGEATATTAMTTVGPVKMPGDDNKDRLGGENNPRIIRILTVIAYICSVSMAAVMLSLYYVFIWDPSPSPSSPGGSTAQPHHQPVAAPQLLDPSRNESGTSPFFQALLMKLPGR